MAKRTSSIQSSKYKLPTSSNGPTQQQNTTNVKQGNRTKPTASQGSTAKNTPVAAKPITTRNRSTDLTNSRPNDIGDTSSQVTSNGVWSGPSPVARNDAQVIAGNDSPSAQSPGPYNLGDGKNMQCNTAAGSVGLSPTKPNPNPNSPTGKQHGTS